VRIRLPALALFLLLLAACGTRAADPPAEASGDGEEQKVAQRLLETMVVPQEDIGGRFCNETPSPADGSRFTRRLRGDGVRRRI
jgi:hypothetical protein